MIPLLVASVALAQEEVSVEGFTELRGSYAVGVDGKPWQLIERIRPEISASLSERVSITSTVEASLVEGRWLQEEVERTFEESDLGAVLEEGGCEWPARPDNEWAHVDEVSDWLRVDRLYVDWYQPKFDLRVGRQPLQWGSAMLINPTDPFPEVLFAEPWRFRRGVNAARTTIPIGQRSQVQAVAATNDTFDVGRVAGRATLNAFETDFSAVGAYRGDERDGIVGVDVKGTAGVGFWFEGAWHVQEGGYEELAVGVDYSFPVLQTLLVGVQYYRNGGGKSDSDDYVFASRASQGIEPPVCVAPDLENVFASDAGKPDPFGPTTLGTDYGLVQVALAVNPDLNVAVVGFQNLRDGTGIAVPNVSWHPTGALEIGATAQLPYRAWGRTGEFKPAAPDLVLEVPAGPGVELEADLNGLVPEATIVAWTRLAL